MSEFQTAEDFAKYLLSYKPAHFSKKTGLYERFITQKQWTTLWRLGTKAKGQCILGDKLCNWWVAKANNDKGVMLYARPVVEATLQKDYNKKAPKEPKGYPIPGGFKLKQKQLSLFDEPVQDLVAKAQILDSLGLHREADNIDKMIRTANYEYTPEFKNWFGDWYNDQDNASKVVDEQTGEPLIVYHGTGNTGFDAFDLDRTKGVGIHFGTKDQANDITKRLQDIEKTFPGKGGSLGVYPVYLNLRNPFPAPDLYDWLNVNDWVRVFEAEELFEDQEEYSDFKRKLYDLSPYLKPADNSAFFKIIRDFLQSKGFDGIVYDNDYEISGKSYIAFNPNQIKSAIGNKGTFDPTKPTIID